MKVLIDGHEVDCINDVKIIYEGPFLMELDGNSVDAELHVCCNYYGITTDVVNLEGEVETSAWHLTSDLAEMTH